MELKTGKLELRLARCDEDLIAAYRLRYRVFVEEMGASGEGVDHAERTESDLYDRWAEHLILVDRSRSVASLDHVVGAYRLLRGEGASEPGPGFYSSSEFNLSRLIETGYNMVELGRSCLHPDYRGGASMYLLWNGLADYVITNNIQILFGVASFHGTDIGSMQQSLSYLHHFHLAPPDLLVTALGPGGWEDRLLPRSDIDRREAMVAMPSLIKAYLRLGGFVGSGAFIDHSFNTVDVCVLMDTARMCQQRREVFERNWSNRS